jgi:hypothetical protein
MKRYVNHRKGYIQVGLSSFKSNRITARVVENINSLSTVKAFHIIVVDVHVLFEFIIRYFIQFLDYYFR